MMDPGRPVKVNSGLTIWRLGYEAHFKPTRSLEPTDIVDIIAQVSAWLTKYPTHQRHMDVSHWLIAFENQNPLPPKPAPRRELTAEELALVEGKIKGLKLYRRALKKMKLSEEQIAVAINKLAQALSISN